MIGAVRDRPLRRSALAALQRLDDVLRVRVVGGRDLALPLYSTRIVQCRRRRRLLFTRQMRRGGELRGQRQGVMYNGR